MNRKRCKLMINYLSSQ